MGEISEDQRRALREEVRNEFPDDEMMRELHFVRRLHELQTQGKSAAERVAFYEDDPAVVSAGHGGSHE